MTRERQILFFGTLAVLIVAGLFVFIGCQHTSFHWIKVEGRTRFYRLHVPSSYEEGTPVPLVIACHGGGGTGRGMERFSRFTPLSEEEGFIVVYPDAISRNWVDGREDFKARSHRDQVDDVEFIRTLIDILEERYSIDPKRIFVTGPSNGGIFSHLIGAEVSDRIAAIAPVIGGMAPKVAREFQPEEPVAVLILQGTEDPLVPYDGGNIGLEGRAPRGRIISTDDSVRKWVEHNGCKHVPTVEELPDADPDDKTRTTRFIWSGGKNGTEVVLYKTEGGGHTWPGGRQYLPKSFVGRVCRDFEATKVIWEFFKAHPKP
jgi:polyhydroxybutyrate depolymerase